MQTRITCRLKTAWAASLLAVALGCVMAMAACLPSQEAFAEAASDASAPSSGVALQVQGLQTQASYDYDIEWYTNNPNASEFSIGNERDLRGFAKLVNGTVDDGVAGKPDGPVSFEGKTVSLGANLSLGAEWTEPIGTEKTPFEGTFDGNRGTSDTTLGTSSIAGILSVIKTQAEGGALGNFWMTVGNTGSDIKYKGLFGYAGDHAVIKNLLLVGNLDKPLSVTNTTNGKKIEHVGAIAGHLGGSLENCKSTVDVSVANNGAVPTAKGEKPEELCTVLYVGGLVGSLGGNMKNCDHGNGASTSVDVDAVLSISSKSAVTDNVPYIAGYVGGLVGLQGDESKGDKTMSTENCNNYGPISFNVNGTAKADRFGNKTYAKSAVVGGIVGYSMASFKNCVNKATINTGILKDGQPLEAYGAVNTGGIVGSLRGPAISNPASSTGVVGSDPTDPGYDVWKNGNGASEPPTLVVEKCENTGYIVGLASVGGMIGNGGAFTRIVGCANSGQIDGTRSTKPCPAGIAGITNGDVAYCSSTGRIRTTTGAGYYASGLVGLLTTYNQTSTKLELVMDAPEIYGCFVTAPILSSTSGGYRSAVIAGESDGFIHDNCFIPDLTADKSIPKDWNVVLGYIDKDTLAISAENQATVQAVLDRVNVLEENGKLKGKTPFSIADGKLVGGTKAELESCCTRCSIIEEDHDRGTVARNWELTPDEMKSSKAVAYLNRGVGIAGNWDDDGAYYFLKSASGGYPVLNWQGGGIGGDNAIDISSGVGLEIQVVSNPQYSAKYAPVPTLSVKKDGVELFQNADYVVVTDGKVKDAGDTEYSVTIKGINAYKGEFTSAAKYRVEKCDVSKCTVAATSKTFNWEQQKPERVTLIDDAGTSLPVDADATGSSEFTWSLPAIPSDADATGAKKYSDGKYYDYTHVHSATHQYDIVVTAKESSKNYTGSTTQPAFHINWAQLVYTNSATTPGEPTAKYDKVVYGSQSWDYLTAVKTKGHVKIKYTGKAIEPKIANPTFLGKTLRDGTGKKYWNDPLNYDFRYVYGNPNPDPTNVKSYDCINATGSAESKLACMAIRFTQGGDFDNYTNVFFEITPASIASDVGVSGVNASYTYTGKAIAPAPKLTYNGMTLKSGTDYNVSYKNNVQAGTATMTLTGKGNYSGTKTVSFKIAKPAAAPAKTTKAKAKVKAKNTMKVKVTAKTVKFKKVKKKAQVVAPFKVTKAKGKVTYKLVKNKKTKKFKINAKGKVTVPKGTKKGTYSVKVKITAKGNASYKAMTKTVTAKIKVK